MSLKSDFEAFCANIEPDNLDEMKTTAGEIAKKLNAVYYSLENDATSHLYIVGSVGRNTAIKNNSDLDLIFDLPQSIYTKFDKYKQNGQSALLQEIKDCLSERYPKTNISGDGQVVVIEFTKYIVELVPGFKQSDDRFKYPDTHDGGIWKYTDPLREQEECANAEKCADSSYGKYSNSCRLIRAWKNKIGFQFGGLLIDTLVYNAFKNNNYYKDKDEYYDIFLSVLTYLKNCDEKQSYWLAVGSNQQVKNTNNGKFVTKAKKSLIKIEKANNKNDVLRELLGSGFPKSSTTHSKYYSQKFKDTEQFIENILPVDIRYDVELECRISQDGWRPTLLSDLLRNHGLLRKKKNLDFYIVRTNCPKPYNIFWKIRNVGDVAEERDCIRGQIKMTNSDHQKEHTDFQGEHYVECYLVKNNICVAKGHIDVPIGIC